MGVNTEFESFEQQLLAVIGEFRSITNSERRLRDEFRAESAKAESAEVARATAERAAEEARSAAAAAAASATQAAAKFARAQDEITNLKIHLDLAERQKTLLEERCLEMSGQIALLERELQQLKPLQSTHSTLQRQYTELQERVQIATSDAQREISRLENELRRVERCAAAGTEIRERARMAAAAHARERTFIATELKHTSRELLSANSETTRLTALVAELQFRLAENNSKLPKTENDCTSETLIEVKSALEAERAGAARLEQALATALADNARLAAQLHAADNTLTSSQPAKREETSTTTNINPIDSFLADET